MGRRLRTMWRLQDPERAPRVLIAPVRALVQRLGPHVEADEPIIVRPGEQRDRDEFVAALVGAGYRREEIVEHRGEVARAEERRVGKGWVSTCSTGRVTKQSTNTTKVKDS